MGNNFHCHFHQNKEYNWWIFPVDQIGSRFLFISLLYFPFRITYLRKPIELIWYVKKKKFFSRYNAIVSRYNVTRIISVVIFRSLWSLQTREGYWTVEGAALSKLVITRSFRVSRYNAIFSPELTLSSA